MDLPEFEITACRGATGGCRFALPASDDFLERLSDSVRVSGWSGFLRERVKGPIRHHHQFRIAVSSCANGCARPHIADVGLVRSARLAVSPEKCVSCGLCVEQCRDGAIRLTGEGPVIDEDTCLGCGYCSLVCPEKAIALSRLGYRILLGGKLGRRPMLGRELPGMYSEKEALDVLGTALRFFMDRHVSRVRFGDILHGAWAEFEEMLG